MIDLKTLEFMRAGEKRLNVDNHSVGHFLTRLNLMGEGVEVGTWLGDLSNDILTNWRGKKLWCVDVYKRQPPEIYNDFHMYSQEQLDQIYEMVNERLKDAHGDRVEMIREFSVSAAGMFDNGSLDFAYIDANHEPGEVMRDLEAWFPKVKKGGLFFGDDYRFDLWPGVVHDVDLFCKRNNLAVFFQKSYWDRMDFVKAFNLNGGKFENIEKIWEKILLEPWQRDGLDNWYVFK